MRSSESLACCICDACILGRRRVPYVKPVGKPDAGNRHVRFDEREGETEQTPRRATAPLLDSTRFDGYAAHASAHALLFPILLACGRTASSPAMSQNAGWKM